jgi:hypothetical protein
MVPVSYRIEDIRSVDRRVKHIGFSDIFNNFDLRDVRLCANRLEAHNAKYGLNTRQHVGERCCDEAKWRDEDRDCADCGGQAAP